MRDNKWVRRGPPDGRVRWLIMIREYTDRPLELGAPITIRMPRGMFVRKRRESPFYPDIYFISNMDVRSTYTSIKYGIFVYAVLLFRIHCIPCAHKNIDFSRLFDGHVQESNRGYTTLINIYLVRLYIRPALVWFSIWQIHPILCAQNAFPYNNIYVYDIRHAVVYFPRCNIVVIKTNELRVTWPF